LVSHSSKQITDSSDEIFQTPDFQSKKPISSMKSGLSPPFSMPFSKKLARAHTLPRWQKLNNSQMWAQHLCCCSPGEALASHLEGNQEETIADSQRQVEEQSSGFGLIMELTVKENFYCQRIYCICDQLHCQISCSWLKK